MNVNRKSLDSHTIEINHKTFDNRKLSIHCPMCQCLHNDYRIDFIENIEKKIRKYELEEKILKLNGYIEESMYTREERIKEEEKINKKSLCKICKKTDKRRKKRNKINQV